MRPMEIKDLVVGLLTILVLAMAVGQFGKVQAFAIRQAASALKGWPEHRKHYT